MPIKFEIYRAGQILTSFTPLAAIAVGPESVPIPGDVVFQEVNGTGTRAPAKAGEVL